MKEETSERERRRSGLQRLEKRRKHLDVLPFPERLVLRRLFFVFRSFVFLDEVFGVLERTKEVVSGDSSPVSIQGEEGKEEVSRV